MNKQEIIILIDSMANFGMPANKAPQLWKRAFDLYNQDKEPSLKLNMNCRPCYAKVLSFLINKFLVLGDKSIKF